MTLEEIKHLYKDLFTLTIDDIVKDFDKDLKSYKEDVNKILYNDELCFDSFVGLLITLAIINIHGADKLSTFDEDKISELINDFYTRHLKRITKKFTSKYGVQMIDDNELNVTARIIKLNKKDD